MTTASARSPQSQIVRVFGKYVLCQEIASGGMATVHMGRLLGAGGFARTVAIKRLHPQFSREAEFVAMFMDEARLSARIQHPNVVSTIDVAALDGELLLVMEYVRGESLARLLKTSARTAATATVDLSVTVAIMDDVLSGLHAAHMSLGDDGHELAVVHRDISPQNILVGEDGVSRVADFGVAKARGRIQTTREGQVKGKSGYFSPEQIRGKTVDARSDIFSASIVLWEMIAGRRLFSGDSPEATMMMVLEAAVAAPSSLVAGLPAGLDEVVLRGLSRNPADRFASAREMQTALDRCVERASPREVGAWVRSVASDVLSARAKMAEAVGAVTTETVTLVHDERVSDSANASMAVDEGESSDTDTSAVVARFAKARSDRRVFSVPVILGIAAAILLAFIVGTWLPRSRPTPDTTASGGARIEANPAPAVSIRQVATPDTAPAAPPLPPPVVAAAPAKTSTSPAPRATPRIAPKPAPSPSAAKPPPSRADRCSPPYSIDASGFRVPKPDCL